MRIRSNLTKLQPNVLTVRTKRGGAEPGSLCGVGVRRCAQEVLGAGRVSVKIQVALKSRETAPGRARAPRVLFNSAISTAGNSAARSPLPLVTTNSMGALASLRRTLTTVNTDVAKLARQQGRCVCRLVLVFVRPAAREPQRR